MNRDNTPKYDKSKIKVTRGSQITPYPQEPTSWIEVTEDELPGNIVQQDVLKVYEYTQAVDESHSNDITIVEENIVQETAISSSSAQTEYIVDKHKYSKEAIKPYFLEYLDLEQKCSSDSTESIKNYLIGEDIYQKLCDEYNSGIKKVDIETGITPKQSSLSCITDYLKSLADKARKKSSQLVFERSLTDPLFKSENNKVNVYPLSCETLKPTIASISSRIKDVIVTRNFVNNELSAESLKNLVLAHVDCEEAQMSELDEPSNTSTSCPPPVEVCHTCGSDSCSEEVHIMCRKGDVQFKLKCRRLGGGHHSPDSGNQVGDEIKYECEVILDNGECIDSSILESRDLKCELCDNTNRGFYPQNIKHDVCADIIPPPPFVPRCDIGPCPPTGALSAPCPPCSPCPPCPKTQEKEEIKKVDSKEECTKKEDPKKDDVKKEDAKKECAKKEDAKKEDAKNNDVKKECEKKEDVKKEVKKEEVKRERFKIIIKAQSSDTSTKSKCPDEEEEIPKIDKCPKEKLIFACRSKSKIKPQEVVGEQKGKNPCPQGSVMFEEIKTAMIEAHCRTVATIKEAARDVFCNADKVLGIKKLCEDPTALDEAKRSAENFVCNLQKTANGFDMQQVQESVDNIRKGACNSIKHITSTTIAAVDEVTTQGKKWLGCKVKEVDEEDRCKPPPLPPVSKCKPRKTSYPNDDDDSGLAETVIETAEMFYDTVCKTTQEAKNVVTDIASHGMKVIGLDTDEPPNRVTPPENVEETPVSKVKRSAENLINEVRDRTKTIQEIAAKDHFEVVRNSAEHVIDKVVSTTQTIKDRTEEAVQELATGTTKIYNKKETIKNVLSGFKFFKGEENERDVVREKEKPVENKDPKKSRFLHRDSSLFENLRHSFDNLSNLDESSPYDKPTPRDVAMLPETSSSKGMFAKIKEKFISMFYDKESKDSLSSDSSSEDEVEIAKRNKEFLFDRFID